MIYNPGKALSPLFHTGGSITGYAVSIQLVPVAGAPTIRAGVPSRGTHHLISLRYRGRSLPGVPTIRAGVPCRGKPGLARSEILVRVHLVPVLRLVLELHVKP